ncbi:MAG TPA: hypothetical protein VI636_14310 [Candidatus Angelobacter sp.]
MILPLNGQKHASTGLTRQVAVMVFPLLSIAVQLVQWGVKALAGVISNAALKIIATKLTSKSIFFFTSTILSF